MLLLLLLLLWSVEEETGSTGSDVGIGIVAVVAQADSVDCVDLPTEGIAVSKGTRHGKGYIAYSYSVTWGHSVINERMMEAHNR